MDNYDVVMGVEIHFELNSNTKIFSPAKISKENKQNAYVHQNDIGIVGTIPSLNKKCVELAIQACELLKLKIDPILRFDRKNYSYFDLAKGYQITQQFYPIGKDGNIKILLPNGKYKKIDIERMHIEEDTAKQINNKNGKIYLDYNRSGIGLVEVVTKPVMYTSFEVCSYVSMIQELMSYSKISEAKMNEGSMRCDINISLKPKGSKILGTKVELKNLNSINNIKLAIEYEIRRQSKILDLNQIIEQETRRFDETKNITISMREKSNNTDYHFLPEPNINPIALSKEFIIESLKKLPKNLNELKNELKNQYNLNNNQVKLLIQNKPLLNFFIKLVKYNNNADHNNLIVNYYFTDVLSYLNKNNKLINETKLSVNNFLELINLLSNKKISSNQAKDILKILFQKDDSINSIIQDQNITQIEDDTEIIKIFTKIIQENPDMLNQYKDRKDRVIKFYMGKAMKETKGKLNPVKAKVTLINLIEEKIQN